MFLYQLNYEKYYYGELEEEKPVILVNETEYNESEFQRLISNERIDRGRHVSFNELVERLEKYGFKAIVTGNYKDF